MKEMKEVYAVVAIVDMSDCTDEAGNSAGNSEEVVGVFSTLAAAEARRDQLNLVDTQAVNDCNCDPTDYVIRTWKLEDVPTKQDADIVVDEPCMLDCPVVTIFDEAREQLKTLISFPDAIEDPDVKQFADIQKVFNILREAERKCIEETVGFEIYKQMEQERDHWYDRLLAEIETNLNKRFNKSKTIEEFAAQVHKEFHDYRIDGKPVDHWLDRLIDKVAEQMKKDSATEDVCIWKPWRFIDEDKMFKTSCLNEFDERCANTYKFCPYCQNKIKVVQ